MTEDQVQAIRKLCRLGGLRPDASDAELRARYPTYIATLVPDGRDAAIVLTEALDLMPPIRSSEAIRNALIGDGTSLGEKREAFMAAHDMSLRTVVRDEEEGAEILVNYITKVLERSPLHSEALAAVDEFDALYAKSYWDITVLEASERGVPIERVLSDRLHRIEVAMREQIDFIRDSKARRRWPDLEESIG